MILESTELQHCQILGCDFLGSEFFKILFLCIFILENHLLFGV